MSIVIRTQSGTAESSTLRPDQPEEVLNVESFRVLSEVADRLGAWLLLDFADTLRELGADRAGVRGFRLVVDSSPERGPYRLVAEWENDLQMPHAPAETELGRLRAELAEVKRERDTT